MSELVFVPQSEAVTMDPGVGIIHEWFAYQQDEPILRIEHGPDYPCPRCGWILIAPDGRVLT